MCHSINESSSYLSKILASELFSMRFTKLANPWVNLIDIWGTFWLFLFQIGKVLQDSQFSKTLNSSLRRIDWLPSARPLPIPVRLKPIEKVDFSYSYAMCDDAQIPGFWEFQQETWTHGNEQLEIWAINSRSRCNVAHGVTLPTFFISILNRLTVATNCLFRVSRPLMI